jgi:signal transduction histidine kinase/CheY-like chemotaxis protein
MLPDSMSLAPSPHDRSLHLDVLESDPLPTFVIRTSDQAIPFELLFCNEAFRQASLQKTVLASTKEATLFRSWGLATRLANPRHIFAGRTWAATTPGSKKGWKIVKAIEIAQINQDHAAATDNPVASAQEEDDDHYKKPKDVLVQALNKRPQVPLGAFPISNVIARWDSLQTMMEMSDVGVFEYLPNGKLIHANDAWYRLSNHPRNLPAHVEFSFMDLSHPDDQATIMSAWNTLVQGNCVTFEMRWKAKPESGNDAQWVLSACVPVFDEDKNLVSIAGNTIDINGQKKLQEVQRRQIDEALEAKRQQENFIDMTSHELRNPLSAVVQCADSVISTLQQMTPKELLSMHSQIQNVNDEISTCIDNLQTIVSCSLHQKRVIDDVLTLSKLDSNLLLITPVLVQPSVVVTEAVKMFDVECSQMQINLVFKEDKSLRNFEWAMLDPSRMIQPLINLLTNAIKFVKDRSLRNITVTLGGSWTHTSIEDSSITFAKDTQPQYSICNKPEWGNGRKGFVWIRVDDTGCGMTDEEQAKLFSRFTQATPRTHVKYGGSGLGLFITKSLTALQGGSVGVKSTADIGSTFIFYISVRVPDSPLKTTEQKLQWPKLPHAISAEEEIGIAKLNILLVEDNLVNQRVLSKQLQKAGCKVSVAGNGVEALECLKKSVHWQGEKNPEGTATFPKTDIDIILMDIEMPVMDGLTCARKIRSWESEGLLAIPTTSGPLTPPPSTSTSGSPLISPHDVIVTERSEVQLLRRRLPILAVSANARSEQVKQALEAGMVRVYRRIMRQHHTDACMHI